MGEYARGGRPRVRPVVTREERRAAEIAHARLLLERDPAIWSWATPAGRARADRRAARIVAAGQLRAGQRWLEIGCGVGTFTHRVAERTSATILATDLSADLVAEAARRHPGLAFQVADAHALPFADASFDGVFGSSVLHHLDLSTALGEILRVLVPGGRMVFAEPNLANPIVLAQKSIAPLKRRALDLPHETAFLRGALANRVRRSGFAHVEVEPFDFLHPLVPGPWVTLVSHAGAVCERVPLLREVAGSCLLVAERPAAHSGVQQGDTVRKIL